MQTVKIRLEAELNKGDLVTTPAAAADALEAAAIQLRAGLVGPAFKLTDIFDVPRGKLVYMIEVK